MLNARPLRRATVCFRYGGDGGYYSSETEHCNETDGQGRFSLSSLPPGKYAYDVQRQGYFAAEPVAEGLPSVIELDSDEELSVKLRMRRGGAISGRVVFEDGEPYSDAVLELNSTYGGGIATSNDKGEYHFANLRAGDYQIGARQPAVEDCRRFSTHSRRIYVERNRALDSLPVHVDWGQEESGPDVVMVDAIPHRVAGRVVSDGQPTPGWLINFGSQGAVQTKGPNGSFEICGVVPGDYVISASGRVGGRMRRGELEVRVEDKDLKDLQISPEQSTVIHARIEGEDDSLDLSQAEIVTMGDSFPLDSVPQPHREADGSFTIDEVYTGEYGFVLSPLPSGSYLKAARLQGQDILDRLVGLHGGETLNDLVFTVSPKGALLTGAVTDEAGTTLPDAYVIVQPDPRHGDRDIHQCLRTTDQQGEFRCDNLAPGKYRAAAWRGVPRRDMWSEAASKGAPVELSEGSRLSIVLTASRADSR